MRADDLLLAKIAYRLVVANAPRCTAQVPATGLVIEALDQYPTFVRPAASRQLGFATPLGIASVVPGSVGDRAGFRAGDGLLAIAGVVLDSSALELPYDALRDRAEQALFVQEPDRAIDFRIQRGATSVTIPVTPLPGCSARFEVIAAATLIARSQHRTIQLSTAFIERFGEDAVAVAFAHELAHLVLRHEKASKQAERDADRLSLHLLAAAGYDPQIAPRFWREHGASMGSRGHDSVKKRISLLEAEIAVMQR